MREHVSSLRNGNRINSSIIDDRRIRATIFVFTGLKFTMEVLAKPILDWTNDGELLERFLKWKKKVSCNDQGRPGVCLSMHLSLAG